MTDITEKELLDIHKYVCEYFNISPEVKDIGLIKAIVERPNTSLYEKFVPYDTIFNKAASIMEATIRWHPFVDGNKRTALTAAVRYLHKNNYAIVIPLSTVRYSVEIAKNQNIDQESTQRLIEEIAEWMKKLSVERGKSMRGKVIRYFLFPMIGLLIWSILDLGIFSNKKLAKWMAFDIYPEYKKEARNITKFLSATMIESMNWKKED